ncbi:MAG: hypothetical protein MI892_09610 [Desulfobacterales bacterium]|nr:hypothetical protein [Desulfobacterales bacterium]
MTLPNKKGWLAIGFILICLAIPFGITYYVSTDMFKERYAKWRPPMPQAPENASLEKSRTINNQVLLVKGERIRVHDTSLIFKGIEGDNISLDLFLEELDGSQAYPQFFPKKIASDKVIRLGDVAYTVKTVNPNTLVLEIYGDMGAR